WGHRRRRRRRARAVRRTAPAAGGDDRADQHRERDSQEAGPGGQEAEVVRARRRIRRDLRLAAWFLWMMPWAAALSMRFTASRSAAAWSSAPESAACAARLTRVLTSERTALFRRRRRSFWRLRLIWLLMFAMSGPKATEPRRTSGNASRSRGCDLSRPASRVQHRGPHRPWQDHADRPHPRADPRRRPPAHARAVPRFHGTRAGAGDHHQGPERAADV